MSKELPYYQFEVAEYLVGDIMICSLEAQGLFSIIKCIYWQKDCKLTTVQLLKRYNKKELLNELIEEGCLKVDEDGNITISFLLEQYKLLSERKEKLSKAGRKGGLNKASLKPPLKKRKATLKHIEEKKEEENRIEEIKEKLNARKLKFSSTLEPFFEIYGKELLNEFYKYWTESNKSQTKFRQELERTWDIKRRLETWSKNDKNFSKKNINTAPKRNKSVAERLSKYD